MITPPQEQNLVSRVHSIAFETMKQSPKNRDNDRNKGEASSLKLLALKILQRNSTRNKSETSVQNEVKQKAEENAPCFIEKTPLAYVGIEQPTDYKAVPLMVSVTGKPQFCIHCPNWTQKGNWWKGLCGVSGALVTNKSRCSIEVMEAVQ